MKTLKYLWIFSLFLGALLSKGESFAAGPKPPYPGPSLVAPLMVDGLEKGSAWVFPQSSEGDFLIEFSPVYTVLQAYVDEGLLSALGQRRLENGLISNRAFQEVQISLKFDEISLHVLIEISPAIKKKRVFELDDQKALESEEFVGPSPVSGYFNFRVNKNFYQAPAQSEFSESSMNVNVENSTTIHGWNLFTGAESLSWDEQIWRRTDTVITRDDEEKTIRYRFGDIYTPLTNFESSLSLGGFSATRELLIQPYRNIRPLNNTEIFLEKPSWVEIAVNGNVVSRFFSAAGVLNLQNYPLVYGLNNIVVKVTDETGREELISLSSYYDYSLLTDGLHRFSYNLGYPIKNDATTRSYDTDKSTLMFRHEYGVEDHWTLGGSISANNSIRVLNGESRWGTEAGIILSSLALSTSRNRTPAYSGKLGFRSFNQGSKASERFLLSANVEHAEADFVTVGSGGIPTGYSWKYDWLITKQLEGFWTVGLGQNGFEGRDSTASRTNYQLNIGKVFRSEFQVGANLSRKYEMGTEDSVFLNFSWRESSTPYQQRHRYISGFHDSLNQVSRVNLSDEPSNLIGGVRLSAGLQGEKENTGVNAKAQYLNNKGDFRVYQENVSHSSSSSSSRTQLSYGTALAWTQNSVGWSRPIADSFVLLSDVHQSGLTIPVNSSGQNFEAEIASSGAGVLPDVLSYHKKKIAIDRNALPEGYSIEPQFATVKPTYRSGIEIPIFVKAQVILQGTLIDRDGKALELEAGEVDVFENGIWVPTYITFFTTEKGRYFIQNLSPGQQYQLRFYNTQLIPLTFVLKSDEVGIVKLPTMVVEKRGARNE